jgi:hypothetical protein
MKLWFMLRSSKTTVMTSNNLARKRCMHSMPAGTKSTNRTEAMGRTLVYKGGAESLEQLATLPGDAT